MRYSRLFCVGDWVVLGCGRTMWLASDGMKTFVVDIGMHKAFVPNTAM